MAKFTAAVKGGKVRANSTPDTILGSGVKDVIYGMGGADTIRAGDGNDTLFGDGKYTFKEAFIQFGRATVQLNSSAPHDATPVLKAEGMLDGASVWSVSNASTVAIQISFWNSDMTQEIVLAIPARSAAFITSPGSGEHFISLGSTIIGSAPSSSDVFEGDVEAFEVEAGNDTIYAGKGDDWIDAGSGNDSIYGEAGNDTMTGGAGADILNGGAGSDIVDYLRSEAGVNISLLSGRGTGGDAEGDSIANVENVRGSGHADVLTGNDKNNKLNGMAGADQLFGMGGSDWIVTGGGYDTIDGGAGTDTVSYEDSWTGVEVDLAKGGRYGSASRDTYINIERVVGSGFDDKLSGDAGNNRLTGAAGADTFIFNAKFGYDRIADFSAEDFIKINDLGFENFADVLAASVDGAAGAIITVAGYGKITVMGYTVSQFAEDDFLFT